MKNSKLLGATLYALLVADDMLIGIKCHVAPFKIGIDAAIQEIYNNNI